MRKKSKYKPRPIIQNPLAYVIGGMLPVNAAKGAMTDLRIKNHGAMAALQQGRADNNDIERLAAACNMGLALMKVGGPELGTDWRPEFEAAADAVLAIARRGGNYTAKADELNALNLAMELHEAQFDKTSVRLFERALELEIAARAAGRGRHVTLENSNVNG